MKSIRSVNEAKWECHSIIKGVYLNTPDRVCGHKFKSTKAGNSLRCPKCGGRNLKLLEEHGYRDKR
jgi:predicted Zn-ribbon and HTH transcriptional regulator